MSFELISADIDAALNSRQAESDDSMNTFFSELVESGGLSFSEVYSIFLVARLTEAFTNGGGPTKELYHARILVDNLSEFVSSLGSRPNADVWNDLLKRLLIQVDKATIADKENADPGQKTGCLFYNMKNVQGKGKKRKVLKILSIKADKKAAATLVVKKNDGSSLNRRRCFPEEKNIKRNKKSHTKESDSTREGLSQDGTEQGNMGEGKSSLRVRLRVCFTIHSFHPRWRTLVTGGREAFYLR